MDKKYRKDKWDINCENEKNRDKKNRNVEKSIEEEG